MWLHKKYIYVVGSKSFRPDQLFKVTNKTNLLFFNIVSLYFNTLFNWYINLTIDISLTAFSIWRCFCMSGRKLLDLTTYARLICLPFRILSCLFVGSTPSLSCICAICFHVKFCLADGQVHGINLLILSVCRHIHWYFTFAYQVRLSFWPHVYYANSFSPRTCIVSIYPNDSKWIISVCPPHHLTSVYPCDHIFIMPAIPSCPCLSCLLLNCYINR